ncbi:MAG: PQQ-like beta-propeller repeat protein, partial [Deltaproteobacteria bacterium]|nr:PQQ-like beta-propeller repeat protein [Deltaproteobacteria bacterium]
YIGSLDGSLYAVYPDGTKKWSYDEVPTGGSIHSTPALSQDESTVYFGHAMVCGGPGQELCPDPSPDYSLIAVDTATGTFIWEFPIEGHIWSSPMVNPSDGSILFPTFYLTGDNYLYSVSPEGVENWRYQMDSFSNGIPSIGPDGTVYIGEFIGGPTTSLYAINPDGTLKWQFELAGNVNYGGIRHVHE